MGGHTKNDFKRSWFMKEADGTLEFDHDPVRNGFLLTTKWAKNGRGADKNANILWVGVTKIAQQQKTISLVSLSCIFCTVNNVLSRQKNACVFSRIIEVDIYLILK